MARSLRRIDAATLRQFGRPPPLPPKAFSVSRNRLPAWSGTSSLRPNSSVSLPPTLCAQQGQRFGPAAQEAGRLLQRIDAAVGIDFLHHA